MIIRIATDKDAAEWNAYVGSQPEATPYHNYAWKKSVEIAYGMNGYYLIAQNSTNGIVGVLPIIHIKTPFSAGKLTSLPYCDSGAALADSEEIRSGLIDRALDLARSLNVKIFEYRETEHQKLPHDDNLMHNQKVRMVLDLPKSSLTLLKGFKAKLRSQIKKAEKNGLTSSLGNTPGLVDSFYHVFARNMRHLGSPTHSKKWFQYLCRYYGNRCIISTIKYKGLIVAAGIILIQNRTATIPWASTLREHNRLAPNMLLYWSLLEYATNEGCKQFDFGRSTYGEGTYKFKQQWGSEPVLLNWCEYELDSKAIRDTTAHTPVAMRRILERTWKRLPVPLTIMIGSRIRKFISL